MDTFAGMLMVASHPVYTLIDTGATHSCLSEEFLSSCDLNVELIPNVAMHVNTPLGSSSMTTRVVKL